MIRCICHAVFLDCDVAYVGMYVKVLCEEGGIKEERHYGSGSADASAFGTPFGLCIFGLCEYVI